MCVIMLSGYIDDVVLTPLAGRVENQTKITFISAYHSGCRCKEHVGT